jgi:hypothetical protein
MFLLKRVSNAKMYRTEVQKAYIKIVRVVIAEVGAPLISSTNC